jgi:protein-S-isoprenylcysteine O-methyltransferase Ste14
MGSRLPTLGRRGGGWVLAQFLLGAAVVVLGIVGPAWPDEISRVLAAVGMVLLVYGGVLFVQGILALGSSLTPFPTPSRHATFREAGVYGRARHPIYGGVLLAALGWSLALSPLALGAAVLLWALLQLKSQHEESMLLERYPEYAGYRERVRRRFVPIPF